MCRDTLYVAAAAEIAAGGMFAIYGAVTGDMTGTHMLAWGSGMVAVGLLIALVTMAVAAIVDHRRESRR